MTPPERPLTGRSAVCLGGVGRATTAAARILADLGADCVLVADAAALGQAERLLLARDVPVPVVEAAPSSLDIVVGFGDSESWGPGMVGPGCNVVELAWDRTGSVTGTDALCQAIAGPAHAVGQPDREPLWFPHRMGEYLLGANAAGLVCLMDALGRTGGVARVALADVWAYATGTNWLLCVPKGIPYVRSGHRAPGNGGVYSQALFAAADGHVTLLCRSKNDWAGFLKSVDDPEWGTRERYQDLISMGVVYPDEVDALVEAETARYPKEELFERARRNGCPMAPVRTPAEAMTNEYLDRQRFWSTVDDVRVPGSLWRDETWRSAAPARTTERRPVAELPVPGTDLAGWRVLDLSWVWAGPMVGSVLADLGADVIKVEHAARLDNMRLRGRLPGGRQVEGDPREIDPLFHNVNRGKRSLLLDMKSDGGREVFLDLVAQSHVVIESFRPHVLDSWGIGYDQLSAVNPGIVLVSLRGLELGDEFGPSGLRSYAPITSSLSGLEHGIRYPGEGPTGGMAIGISDPVAGWHGAMLALAAMVHRRRSGTGGWIRLSQLETLSSILPEMYVGAQGHPDDDGVMDRAVRCADGDVLISGDPQDVEIVLRQAGIDGPVGVTGVSLAELAAWAGAAGLTFRRVLPIEEHVRWSDHVGREMLFPVKHSTVGDEMLYAHGWQLDGRMIAPRASAPLIGEHTAQVMAEYLGADPERIEELRRRGVLT